MRRLGVVWMAVLAAVVLSGCARESGSSDGASPTSLPVVASRGLHQRKATARGESAAPASLEVMAGEAEGDVAGRAYRSPASADDASVSASGPMPIAEEPTDRPSTATTAPAEDRPAREVARRDRGRDPGPDPPRVRQSHIQSGTLTAGSFDDHERFDDYRQFLSEAMQGDDREQLPRLAIGTRVMIHVSDARGEPVGDARVVVREAVAGQQVSGGEDDAGPALVDLVTGSDGRTLFLTGHDGASHDGEYLVTVHPPDRAEPVTRRMHDDQGPWRITLPDTRAKLPRKLDLALVIDTTGSMGDELEYLKVEIDSIAKTIYQMFPGVDQRYALVVYRDDGDEYVTRTFDFTGSLEEFRVTLSEQSANGGGDYPEAVHLALESAGKLDWRERDAARVLFLVGDAPPHDRFAGQTLAAVEALRGRGVRVFAVGASGVAMKAEFVMRAAGFLTLGQYLFLTDHSGVGNPHAKPHVPDYQVERLDRLMIRMIASELSGRHLAADEVIALETGDGTLPRPDQGPIDQQQQRDPATPVAARASVTLSELPRWLILVAAVLGLCVVDTLMTRDRG
ncbi:MAG TPA: VWA domain-containing protein [Thermoguttaceae bacterium]|nr:VWA domain-containing protein [Thermoguttaceae bacterium]